MPDEPEILVHRAPIAAGLADELAEFWQEIFETSFEESREVLGSGIEAGRNHDTVWVVRGEGSLASTCRLTVSSHLPTLGGLGEVATAATHRRQGLGERLCREARGVFREGGGEALFLGTVNPAAARVYFRLGWRRLAGTTVMLNVTGDLSPEEYLVDWFRSAAGDVVVRPGSARARLAMIPLLVVPHDEQLLDANVGLFSTRYATQNSCMGLYPRYTALEESGGTWFAAWAPRGHLVGLASARPLAQGVVQIDACTHRVARSSWRDLLEAAIDWARNPATAGTAEATEVIAVTSVEDESKRIQFEALGFHPAGAADEIDVSGRRVATLRLRLRL